MERGKLVVARGLGAPPDPFLRVARFALGLDAARAARLWTTLPRALPLALGPAELERASRELGRAGLGAHVETETFGVPCARHSRWLATEVCPRCGERRACVACVHAEPDACCASCARTDRFFTRFRHARIAVLLAILLGLIAYGWWDSRRVHWWREPLDVAIIPVVVDADTTVESYAASLRVDDFAPVAAFFEREGARFLLDARPVVRLHVGAPQRELPPEPPAPDADLFDIASFSLRLRAWSVTRRRDAGVPWPDATVWLLLHRPGKRAELDRSIGVPKARIALVRVDATRAGLPWANVAIAHELLHTVDATDKYGPTGMPTFPEGFADPARARRFPQERAELMSGAVPLAEGAFVSPESLDECMVGEATAREIGWRR